MLDNRSSCHEKTKLLNASPSKSPQEGCSSASLRRDVWIILNYSSTRIAHSSLHLASYILQCSILTLILLNVVVAIVDSSQGPHVRSAWYQLFLYTSTVVFTIEYLLRLWSCTEDKPHHSIIFQRIQWSLKPMSLIDLAALVPFYLEIGCELITWPTYSGTISLRALRLLRILSFLRLERSYNALHNLMIIFKRKQEELLVVSYLTAVLVLTSSTIIFFMENQAQPKIFSSIGTCAWWSIETITSLGYGDIVPVTNTGRCFASILALWGIILFTIPGAVLGSGFIELMLEKQREEIRDFTDFTFRSDVIEESNSVREKVDERMPSNFIFSREAEASQSQSSRLELLHAKMDQLAFQQQQLQEQMKEQQLQLNEISKSIHRLLDHK